MRVSLWVFVCGVIRLVWPLRALRARPVHLERLILRWEGEVEQRGPSVGTFDHEKLYNWDWSQSCHTSHTASVTLTVTVSRIVTQAQPIIHHNITCSHRLNNANRTCHHGLRWYSAEIINWSQVSGRMSLRRDVGAPSWDDDDCDIKIFKIFSLELRPGKCCVCVPYWGGIEGRRAAIGHNSPILLIPVKMRPGSHLHNGAASAHWLILVHTAWSWAWPGEGEGICRHVLSSASSGRGPLGASTNRSKGVWY